MDWDFMYIYAKKELKLSDEEYYTMSLGKFLDLCDVVYELNNPEEKSNLPESNIIKDDKAKRNALKSMMG